MMWLKQDASCVWFFPAILLSFLNCISAKLTPELCRDLGFTSNLLCSSCDELSQFDLDDLLEGCRGCCHADQNDAAPVKVFCLHIAGRQNTQETFVVGKKRNQFPSVNVKYVRGKDPILKLFDDYNEMKEELSIDKWTTDTIEEFLKEKLQ